VHRATVWKRFAGTILYRASDQQLLLAERPPSRLQRRVAYGAIAAFLAIFCITVPFADVQLPIVTAFIPIQTSVIVVNDLITAALLASQFWVLRRTWLLVLAAGYWFTALIFVAFMLTFPGVFAPTGLMGAGLQTASWISTCLHMALPVFLIIAMLVRQSRGKPRLSERAPVLVIVLSFTLATAIVCAVTWASIAYDKVLPPLLVNAVQHNQNIVPRVMPNIAVFIIAIVLLWRRGRSVLDLWLLVMCCAGLFEVTIGGLFAGGRYSVGWYTGRIVQVAATYCVLLLLLSETTALYANTVRTAMRRRGARHSRQIAMDAMAASIGHEIKQPLTALIANGNAGKLLTRDSPALREVHAIFSDMVAEGQRIARIIGSVRTMFKDSSHDRQPVSVNTVVRDVLSMVELDLRLQGVSVRTDLDKDIPPVLGDSGQLHQMFLNLVTNAIEAMSSVDGRARHLTITSQIVDGSDIAVTVADSGAGIAAGDRSRIFEAFFSTKAAGTGVGLTVCQVVLKAHGGRLEVAANKPFGTVFRVVLPAGESQ
jgi:signal transduction histidine kinase